MRSPSPSKRDPLAADAAGEGAANDDGREVPTPAGEVGERAGARLAHEAPPRSPSRTLLIRPRTRGSARAVGTRRGSATLPIRHDLPNGVQASDVELDWSHARTALTLATVAMLLGLAGHSVLALLAATLWVVLLTSALALRDALAGLEPLPLGRVLTVAGARARVALTVRSRHRALRDLLVYLDESERGRISTAGHTGWLALGETRELFLATRFSRRGRLDHVHVEVRSAFPFGWIEARRRFRVPIDLLVLPRLEPHGWRHLSPSMAGADSSRSQRDPTATEYHALREWREGESLRRVHWKLSARRGRRLVRECRGQDERCLRVRLCNESLAPFVASLDASFERAVSLAATLLHDAAARGWRVALECTRGETGRARGIGAGPHVARALRAELATVERVAGHPVAAALDRFGGRDSDHDLAVLILCGGGRRIDSRRLQREGVADVVLDVDSPLSKSAHRSSVRRRLAEESRRRDAQRNAPLGDDARDGAPASDGRRPQDLRQARREQEARRARRVRETQRARRARRARSLRGATGGRSAWDGLEVVRARDADGRGGSSPPSTPTALHESSGRNRQSATSATNETSTTGTRIANDSSGARAPDSKPLEGGGPR